MIVSNLKINDVEYIHKTKMGIQYIERLDFELDSGTLIIPFTMEEKELAPLSRVELVIGDDTIHFFSLKDNVQLVAVNPLIYRHVISLIEPTKLLEKYSCWNMTFTQPINSEWTRYNLKSYVERLHYNVPLEVESKWASTRLFDISSDFDELGNFDMPEIFLNKANMREAIDMGLEKVDGIVRADFDESYPSKKLNLSIDYFNLTRELINAYTNTIALDRSQDGEDYYSEAEIYVENSVNNIRGVSSPGGVFSSMRSEEASITTTNRQIITNNPIDRIEQVIIRVRSQLLDELETTVTTDLDITSFVYEEDLWRALPEPKSSETRNKGNCVYYTRGDNKIRGFGDDVAVLWGLAQEEVIKRLVKQAMIELVPPIDVNNYNTFFGIDQILWNMTYYPQVNAVMRMDKPNFSGITTQMPMSQQGNQVDIDVLARNMVGTIKKVGNSELSIRVRIKQWANRVRKGDYTNDGFIVTNIETSLLNEYIEQNIEFSKDYNKMSMYVGVNQEARQIPIPKGGVNTYLHYKEYALIQSYASVLNDSSIKTEMIKKISEGLQTLTGSSIFGAGIFFTSTSIIHYVYKEAEFAPTDTTFKLTFGFDSPVMAGLKFIPPGNEGNTTARPLLQGVPYANRYGRFDGFNFKLANFAAYDTTPLDIIQYANKLPQVVNSDASVNVLIDTERFKYKKDTSEILKVTYQIPLTSYIDNVIAGTHFWNIIMGGQGSGKLWASTTEIYNKNNNIKCKGIILGNIADYFTITYDAIKITIAPKSSLSSYASVGFGDSDGNLILGINTQLQLGPFYINFKNKIQEVESELLSFILTIPSIIVGVRDIIVLANRIRVYDQAEIQYGTQLVITALPTSGYNAPRIISPTKMTMDLDISNYIAVGNMIAYSLVFSSVAGVNTQEITRISSPLKGAAPGTLSSASLIYYGDQLVVSNVTWQAGYNEPTIEYSGDLEYIEVTGDTKTGDYIITGGKIEYYFVNFVTPNMTIRAYRYGIEIYETTPMYWFETITLEARANTGYAMPTREGVVPIMGVLTMSMTVGANVNITNLITVGEPDTYLLNYTDAIGITDVVVTKTSTNHSNGIVGIITPGAGLYYVEAYHDDVIEITASAANGFENLIFNNTPNTQLDLTIIDDVKLERDVNYTVQPKTYALDLSGLDNIGVNVRRLSSLVQNASIQVTLTESDNIYYNDVLLVSAYDNGSGYEPDITSQQVKVYGNIAVSDYVTESLKTYTFTIASISHVGKQTIERLTSPIGGATLGVVYDSPSSGSFTAYHNDTYKITAIAITGYTPPTVTQPTAVQSNISTDDYITQGVAIEYKVIIPSSITGIDYINVTVTVSGMSPVNAVSGTKYPYGSYLTITAPAKTGYYASTVKSPVYLQSPLDYTQDVNVSSYITAGTIKTYTFYIDNLVNSLPPVGIATQRASIGGTTLSNGQTIYYGDIIFFEATASTGYNAPTIYTGDSDEYLTVTSNVNTSEVISAGTMIAYTLTKGSVTGVSSYVVTRTSSPYAGTGVLTGGSIYYGDVLTITSLVASTGYNIPSATTPITVTGNTNTANYITAGNVLDYKLTLSILPAGVASQNVFITSSPLKGTIIDTENPLNNLLSDDATIHYGDVLEFSATASQYYNAPVIDTGEAVANKLTVTGNVATSSIISAGSLDVTIPPTISGWAEDTGMGFAYKLYWSVTNKHPVTATIYSDENTTPPTKNGISLASNASSTYFAGSTYPTGAGAVKVYARAYANAKYSTITVITVFI